MERLKRLRAEKKLSQARLAARAELDPSTVNQIERGAREASPATLRKLADALGVNLYDLLKDEAPKVQAPSTSPKEAAEAGPSELSANDLSDLCGEIYAELQSVRETPAEDLKTQAIADLDADLKEAQAALSTAIYRKGPPRLSEWSMQRVIRQRRQRAQQSHEDDASETG
jgi:transcriptional regulator with XRE-family HTH domain